MKKTILVLSVEVVLIFIVSFAVLFLFKIFPFNGSQTSRAVNIPVSPELQGVKLARVLYSFNGTLKELRKESNGEYAVVFIEAPKDTFYVGSDTKIFQKDKPGVLTPIADVRPGSVITIYASYDLKAQKWSTTTTGAPRVQTTQLEDKNK